MKTKLLLLLAAFGLAGASARAQTTGDISIIGFRSDADDALAFVSWVDLVGGTQIHFTDSGFFSDGTLRDSENTMTWTAPVLGISAGTVIVITSPSGSSANIGTTTGALGGLSNSGDQIFAGTSAFPSEQDTTMPGSAYAGTLLHGLDFNGTAGWDLNATDSNTSALPTALNVAFGNIAITHIDNAQYTGLRVFSDLATAKAAVHNTANWSGNNDGATFGSLNSTAFVIPEPSSIILVGVMGLAGLLVLRRKKK